MNVESSIESHLEMTIRVGGEGSKERLLEDGHGERIGENEKAVCRVAEGLHFEETDLIEAASVDIDSVSVG